MNPLIRPIKLNESSNNVAALHDLIRSAGFSIDSAEVQEQRAGPDTARLVGEFQRLAGIQPEEGFLVDQATADAINRLQPSLSATSSPYLVYGVVTQASGDPARGLSVKAFDQGMRVPVQIGVTVETAGDGGYRIPFAAPESIRIEGDGPDILVQVYGVAGELLQTSDVRFDCHPITRVDLTVPTLGQEDEYSRLVRLLTPLTEGQGVTLDTLEENADYKDLSFASGETGLSLTELGMFATSRRLAATKLPPEFWFAVLMRKAIAFPGQLDQTGIEGAVQAATSAIPSSTVAAVTAGLNDAIENDVIASGFKDSIAAWLKAYDTLMRSEAVKEGSGSNASSILDASGISARKRNALLGSYLQGGSIDDQIQRVRESKQFTAQETDAFAATLYVNDLVVGDQSLLKDLRPNVTSQAQVRRLAQLSNADWVAAIDRSGSSPPAYIAGQNGQEQKTNYAAFLARRAAFAYPTSALSGDLSRALGGGTPPSIPGAQQILDFFNAHPEFELASTSVDGFLQNQASPAFFNAAQSGDLATNLKTVQRVFKLAPSYAASNQFLSDGLQSARQIYNLGESQFVQTYSAKLGMSEMAAQNIYQKAANTHAAVTTIVGQLRATQNANKIQGLTNVVPQLSTFPDIQNLFGDSSSCDCDECQSIFGPAAYLADLLKYLEGRLIGGKTAKDLLFARRPDLGYIELDCDNAMTPLPYIDLVCEILEDRVAPWILFQLPTALEPDLVEGPADANVVAAFAGAGIPLTAEAHVSNQDAFGAWLVHDTPDTYKLAVDGANLDVSYARQTHGTAEERAADPEYENPNAYTTLKSADYPMTLPFDLFSEEVRAYLAAEGVSRADLMEAFRGPNPPNNPADLDIVCEFLSINQSEQALILKADAANQFKYWGAANNAAAIAAMTNVQTFLDFTSLLYADLNRLLSLKYINPGGAITIQIIDLDPALACEISNRAIQVLDANALDRFHRFIRLWRKLGWQMWEVDLAIQTFGVDIDPNLALSLYPFLRVKGRFAQISVEQLCAFYAPISTTSKYTAAYQSPDPSLYEELFLNKRLVNPLDPDFSIANVTAGATAITPDKVPTILAATKLRAADLSLLEPAGWDGKLSLPNLSFLYRNGLLARALALKMPDWTTLIFLTQQNPFADPATTWAFLKTYDRITASGFKIDQLNYILSDDPSAKAAPAEKAIVSVLAPLQKSLNGITVAANPAAITLTVDGLSAAITQQLQNLGWDSASVTSLVSILTNQYRNQRAFATAPAGWDFPAPIKAAIPVSFDGKYIAVTGAITSAQKATLLTDPSLAAVTGNPDYQGAIGFLFDSSALLLKFYRPFFAASLSILPPDVDLNSLGIPGLSSKVSFDTDLLQLTFFGGMSVDEQAALLGLSVDPAYQAAVNSLFNQPRAYAGPASELWMTPEVLVADPLTNLTNADLGLAPTIGLNSYLATKLSTDQVVQQLATALGLTQTITRNLLTQYAIFGTGPKHVLLDDFLAPLFVNTSAAPSAASFPEMFSGYDWLMRVALIIKTLAMSYSDLLWTVADQPQTQVLDITSLPLVFISGAAPTPLGSILDLSDFMSLHHSCAQDDLTVLMIVDRLINSPGYDLSEDLAELTAWAVSDIEWLIGANHLDIAYPVAFQGFSGWRRLIDTMTISQQIGGGAAAVAGLADPGPSASDSASLKQMIRSTLDEPSWIALSEPIQDSLRERKRDSLVAYLLTQPMPADNPTGKWDDPADLFAYNLIDVEMNSCQPTSRIVQGSAAVQLYVQRCFMGLEPDARVSVDVDSGWLEWQWRKYYRLWEANREVFAYPENYAEPELRKDKSEIFSALETELQQNSITRDTVETAFEHYLDALDAVAQLEIAGTYYQESNQTLHLFGRTIGADPRDYYYRQHISGRRWTAWQKVDCDIQSDYVVPLVTNERLYLVWPELRYTNPPHPTGGTTYNIPNPGTSTTDDDMGGGPPRKQINAFIAVTELKSGKWTPKRTSRDSANLGLWTDGTYPDVPDAFPVEHLTLIPIDLTWLPNGTYLLELVEIPEDVAGYNYVWATFELAGCKGVPELYTGTGLYPYLVRFLRDNVDDSRNLESYETSADGLIPYYAGNTYPEILGLTPGSFKISYPHYLSFFDKIFLAAELAKLAQAQQGETAAIVVRRGIPATFGTFYDWFYADKTRTFFVRPELHSDVFSVNWFYEDLLAFIQELQTLIAEGNIQGLDWALFLFFVAQFRYEYHFYNFYHPLVCLFAINLYQRDIEGLMDRKTQFADGGLDFNTVYAPQPIVDLDYPKEPVDFTPAGSYSLYNWELFFHAPLMIAERLTANQQFEESKRWLEFIFDPTGGHDTDPITGLPAPAPQKYWITQPFYLRQEGGPDGYLAESLDALMTLLATDPTTPSTNPAVLAIQQQVMDWRQDPFDPHLVAQYRTVAYQKLAVMKYLDNLIAWGDQLFTTDTLEAVNSATQLYVCAAEIIGRRTETIPPPAESVPLTFNELDSKLDAFSNALIDFENLIPPMPPGGGSPQPLPPIPDLQLLYFCIPQNSKWNDYWNTVQDRLYKIRNCLNIEGIFSPPALFAPPINPMALVAATASGEDLSTALLDLAAPLPYYRCSVLIPKANEFISDVKALGAALLAALEKKDAEALALLRQTQEIALGQAIRDLKKRAIDEAQSALDGLKKNEELVTIRRDYYAGRDFMNAAEITAMSLSGASTLIDAGIAVAYVAAGGLSLIPNFLIGAYGFGGAPAASGTIGGDNAGRSAENAAKTLTSLASALDKGAGIASTLGSYNRRSDDWGNQVNLANKELEQIGKQIDSAQARLDIAQLDLANQDLQIKNAQAISDFMTSKYTNADLYSWMIGQVAGTYFRAYQVALDLAKKAERCYRYELGLDDSDFIQPAYWDSLHSGLQAGEMLQLDLRRLESSYLDQNRREFECVKNVSLALLDPVALISLKTQGWAMFDLPEELFDLDFAGHYFRRIKTVSLSIPCVGGPNITVSATLRLVKNMIRVNSQPGSGNNPTGSPYRHNADDTGAFMDDDRFRVSNLRVNAIATCSGQNDSGMFQLNFDDPRFLPFEGAGAISTWRLELPQDPAIRQFNYDTIADAILTVRYTAREDMGQFFKDAVQNLHEVLDGTSVAMPLLRGFDLIHEFPTEWYAFLHPAAGQETLTIQARARLFPFQAQSGTINFTNLSLYVRTIPTYNHLAGQIDVGGGPLPIPMAQVKFNGVWTGWWQGDPTGFSDTPLDESQPWTIHIGKQPNQWNTITDGDVLACFLVAEYDLQ